jgi:hypothetical protein
MNKNPAVMRYIKFNLAEAKESLGQLLKKMNADPKYPEEYYWMDMGHIYGHINTAWNARNASAKRVLKLTDRDFNQWNKFPGRDKPFVMEVSVRRKRSETNKKKR